MIHESHDVASSRFCMCRDISHPPEGLPSHEVQVCMKKMRGHFGDKDGNSPLIWMSYSLLWVCILTCWIDKSLFFSTVKVHPVK